MEIELTNSKIIKDCLKLAKKIKKSKKKYDAIWPVPMGGFPVAGILSQMLEIPLVLEQTAYCLIVDDLIDSGKTLSEYTRDKAVLYVKNKKEKEVTFYVNSITNNSWIKFPWEKETNIEHHITRQLEYIGEDVTREGLIETPKRIRKSWDRLFGGYNQNPKDLIKTFDKETYDQMVLLKDIEFYSTCEHHFLPFFGKAHIAYIPNKKVIGVSKLARILEVFARRMQIQERIGEQITTFLMKELNAKGAACILEAQHFCMTSRGIEKQKSKMVTSSLKGVFLKEHDTRGELYSLII